MPLDYLALDKIRRSVGSIYLHRRSPTLDLALPSGCFEVEMILANANI